MFAVSEIVPGGVSTGQSQSQQQVIASVVALQKVIASQASAEGNGASSGNMSGGNEAARQSRATERSRANLRESEAVRAQSAEQVKTDEGGDSNGVARSIVEAQEASQTDQMITAAFQARHGLTDLLSVIRDPEDLMLPVSPDS